MNCTKAEALIQARLDGELSIDEAIGLGEHFALCAECKALATDLDQVCGAARTLIDLGTAGGESIAARATAQIARELYDLEADEVMDKVHPAPAAIPALGEAAVA